MSYQEKELPLYITLVDISKYMLRHHKKVLQFLDNYEYEDTIILFDTDLIFINDIESDKIKFKNSCSFYDCVSNLVYILHKQYKKRPISITVYSPMIDNSSTMHDLESFERYINHMMHYYPISITFIDDIAFPLPYEEYDCYEPSSYIKENHPMIERCLLFATNLFKLLPD